jgi:peptidoglycan L-alanyl-D-glutamate endopeptidase CwlK
VEKLMKFSRMYPIQPSGFVFSARSLARFEGVDPRIVRVTKLALDYSEVDFGITCGLRTLEEQKLLVAEGRSRTLKSKHLTGHAVDVVAYKGGKVSWAFGEYLLIAEAFRLASEELGTPITWGAAWLAPLANYNSPREAWETYKATRIKQDREPFIDGPHFQL